MGFNMMKSSLKGANNKATSNINIKGKMGSSKLTAKKRFEEDKTAAGNIADED